MTVILVVSAAALLEPRKNDVLSFWKRMSRDISQNLTGVHAVDDGVPEYTRELGLDELKRMLVSSSPALRRSAIRALGERKDLEIVPYLIKLMDGSDQAELEGQKDTVPISDLAKTATGRIVRRCIQQDPANISFLMPYLNGAMVGSDSERKAYIQLLGEIREPLAVPLLSHIAESDSNHGPLAEAARIALTRIDSEMVESDWYASTRAHQIRTAAALSVFVALLTLAGVVSMAKGGEGRFSLLSVIPLLVCAGLAGAVGLDLYRGTVTAQTVDRAIADRNLMSLRTMTYQEHAEFPGDSLLARRLVQIGDDEVIRDLALVPSLEPDDSQWYKAFEEKLAKWVLSRLVASRLGTPALKELVSDTDPYVRYTIAETLDRLMVRNEAIKDSLTILTRDENEHVVRKASETLLRITNRPVWPDFALLGSRSSLPDGHVQNALVKF